MHIDASRRKETSTFKINFSKISDFVDFSQWQVTEMSLRGGWWREGRKLCRHGAPHPHPPPRPRTGCGRLVPPGPDTDGDGGAGLGSGQHGTAL